MRRQGAVCLRSREPDEHVTQEEHSKRDLKLETFQSQCFMITWILAFYFLSIPPLLLTGITYAGQAQGWVVPVSVTPWFQRLLALKDGKHKTMVRRDLVVAVNNVPASESWSCCATAKVASDSSSGATTAESGRVIRRESKNEKRRRSSSLGTWHSGRSSGSRKETYKHLRNSGDKKPY